LIGRRIETQIVNRARQAAPLAGATRGVARALRRHGLSVVLASALLACAQTLHTDAQQRLNAAVQSRPVVLLGEVHDNPRQHEMRLAALQALLASGARPTLLMEQFDRERQADLDAALAAAGASADSVIGRASAGPRAGWDWRLYRPFVALAIEHGLPLVAANVSRSDARRASDGGLATLGLEADVPAELEAAQARIIVNSHCNAIDDPLARRMSIAQVARDKVMAQLVETHAPGGAVLLAGNGHVRSDIGVARWLSSATRQRTLAIGLVEEGDESGAVYDVVVKTVRHARPDPCAGFSIKR